MDNLDFRFRENDRIKRIVLTAGQLIILTGLLFSFSRGAWVAVAAGILATGILLLINRDKKNLLRLGKQTFFSLLLIAMALIIFKSVFFARFNAQNRLEAMSLNERKSQAREAINFFWTKPLTGVGAGAYTLAAYQQNPNLPTWRYQPVHNIYFLTLAELGVVGFIIVSLFHCFIVSLFVKRRSLWIVLGVVLIVGGMFDHWFWSMYTGIVVWGVGWGLILKMSLFETKDAVDNPNLSA